MEWQTFKSFVSDEIFFQRRDSFPIALRGEDLNKSSLYVIVRRRKKRRSEREGNYNNKKVRVHVATYLSRDDRYRYSIDGIGMYGYTTYVYLRPTGTAIVFLLSRLRWRRRVTSWRTYLLVIFVWSGSAFGIHAVDANNQQHIRVSSIATSRNAWPRRIRTCKSWPRIFRETDGRIDFKFECQTLGTLY